MFNLRRAVSGCCGLIFSIFSCVTLGLACDDAVSPEQANELIEQNNELVLLDVRNPDEFAVAHYPGAINIPVKELQERYAEVPAAETVLINCARGRRAKQAYIILKKKRPDLAKILFVNGKPIFH